MTMRYPNLVTVNGVSLTDESRTFSEDRDERSIKVTLASGRTKKFVQGVWRTWSISWSNVAANATETVDGHGGRDEIRSIAEGAGFVQLILDGGEGDDEIYMVEVTGYKEDVLQRRGPGGFRYSCSLDLAEQGGEA
jgi:hypothetical protein